MGTNSGKSRGRLAGEGSRDKTVAFLKGIGVDMKATVRKLKVKPNYGGILNHRGST